MSGAHRAERAHSRQGRPLPALLLARVALLGATGGLGTFAYWNDVETVSGGTITAGSLDLTVEGVQGPYTWSALEMESMAPGESVAADLTIANAGTTPFTVQVRGTAAGALAPYVTTTVYVGGKATADTLFPRNESCSGTAGPAAQLTSPTPVLLATTDVLQPPAGSTSLCVVMTLHAAAPKAVQGTLIEASFKLDAMQVRS